MEVAANLRQSNRRWPNSLLASVLLHAAALWLIGAGQLGVSQGVPGGRLYALNYLGAVAGSEAAPKVDRATAPTRVEPRPAVQPAKPARPAKPAPPATSQLLSSSRGKETVPLPPKPGEESPQGGATPPTATSAEPSGGATGGGEAAPAPPKGTGMVAALPRLVYPKAAQNAGLQGTVRLRVTVSPEGKPIRVEVERRSGEPTLDDYARRAVERGLSAHVWVSPYVIRMEARFAGGAPDLRVIDEPVEVGG